MLNNSNTSMIGMLMKSIKATVPYIKSCLKCATYSFTVRPSTNLDKHGGQEHIRASQLTSNEQFKSLYKARLAAVRFSQR